MVSFQKRLNAMSFFSRLLLGLTVFAPLMVSHVDAQESGTARLDRTTLMIRDMEESFAFWRDVMQFDVIMEPRELDRGENVYLGWSDAAVVRFARFQSPDGAGIGLLEVVQEDYADLNLKDTPTGYGDAILVLIATDIDAIYARAQATGAVLKPLGLSPSGRSKQMFLEAPSGHVLEVYELLPAQE